MVSEYWPRPCSSPYRNRDWCASPASATKAENSIPVIPLTTRATRRARTWPRISSVLRNPADLNCNILVGTVEPGHSRLLQHHPVDGVSVLQSREIWQAQIFPWRLRLHLRPPDFSQRREHTYHAIVFHPISQTAPLSQAAKSNLVFSLNMHVIRIQRKDRIGRSVLL